MFTLRMTTFFCYIKCFRNILDDRMERRRKKLWYDDMLLPFTQIKRKAATACGFNKNWYQNKKPPHMQWLLIVFFYTGSQFINAIIIIIFYSLVELGTYRELFFFCLFFVFLKRWLNGFKHNMITEGFVRKLWFSPIVYRVFV